MTGTLHEPLSCLIKDLTIDLAKYADENQVLDQPGWQSFQAVDKRKVHLSQLI